MVQIIGCMQERMKSSYQHFRKNVSTFQKSFLQGRETTRLFDGAMQVGLHVHTSNCQIMKHLLSPIGILDLAGNMSSKCNLLIGIHVFVADENMPEENRYSQDSSKRFTNRRKLLGNRCDDKYFVSSHIKKCFSKASASCRNRNGFFFQQGETSNKRPNAIILNQDTKNTDRCRP